MQIFLFPFGPLLIQQQKEYLSLEIRFEFLEIGVLQHYFIVSTQRIVKDVILLNLTQSGSEEIKGEL